MEKETNIILIRGGGDLASGIAVRLHRSGYSVVITELPHPLAVRRWVAFSEAVLQGEWIVEGITGVKVNTLTELVQAHTRKQIPVAVDPLGEWIEFIRPKVIVDARMRKTHPEDGVNIAPLVIGLGPGFCAGVDCDAVIETQRGHFLGRVYWNGTAESDSGIPDSVSGKKGERVLRSPEDGVLKVAAKIGEMVDEGQTIAMVNDKNVTAMFSGVIRGLLYDGLFVYKGMKIGDVDPRNDSNYCALVSDKSLAIGGAVLEAVISRGFYPG